MNKIVIVGWYGTETIGDRAILAGLIRVFCLSYKIKFQICICSIYPFLTERTLLEDNDFFKEIAEGRLEDISVFALNNIAVIKQKVKECSLLVFGGGPLMDIPNLIQIEYIFRYAKKHNIKTTLLGCGVGPIFKKLYIKSMLKIISNSDLTIFRDTKSQQEYERLGGNMTTYSAIDPAVFAAIYYTKHYSVDTSDYIAINFRDIEGDSYDDSKSSNYRNIFKSIIEHEQQNGPVKLIPMHTFVVGGDDRYYFYSLAKDIERKDLYIQCNPLSLRETMEVFSNAKYCYGMRFHSVLLQTILNGNNIILDYTNPTKGKIVGLLESLGIFNSVIGKQRYVSLISDNHNIPYYQECGKIDVNECVIDEFFKIYIDNLRKLINEDSTC